MDMEIATGKEVREAYNKYKRTKDALIGAAGAITITPCSL